jgi:hypothetical protein
VSIWKLLPAKIHGVADFGSALALIVVALVLGGSGAAVATGVALGVVLVVVSLFTDYPLGMIRLIPFRVHSAGDYLGAAALIAAPFVLGFNDSDGGASAFYVAMGAALIGVSLVTDYDDSTSGS